MEFDSLDSFERDLSEAGKLGKQAFGLLDGRFGKQNAKAVLRKLPDQDPGRQRIAKRRCEFALQAAGFFWAGLSW